MQSLFLVIPVLLPVAAALWLRFADPKGRTRDVGLEAIILLTSVLVWALVLNRPEEGLELFRFAGDLTVTLRLDSMGSIFAGLVAALWPFATLYAYCYMEHDERQNAFLVFYTLTYSVTLGIAFSGNLLTLYFFYELLTIVTVPLVMHDLSREAIRASRKYLYYSLGGAAFAFMGIAFLIYYGGTLDFIPQAALNSAAMLSHHDMMLVVYVMTFFGFSVKAAMFPFHGWLPTASVAPTPVTALLHAVAVVKSGAFAILRLTYFSYGTIFLAGTSAQSIVMLGAILTIVYASTMAAKEIHLKRRLAYSTISNLSYILLAASTMTELGLIAALAHLVFHALMKCCSFFCAGAIMHQTERSYIYELDGVGYKMPIIFTCFTVAGLSLAGIPPLAGFLSKWSIAEALLTVERAPFAKLALCALIYSAFMTAVYILTVVVRAFARVPAEQNASVHDPDWRMTLPIALLAAAVIAFGLYSEPLYAVFRDITTWHLF